MKDHELLLARYMLAESLDKQHSEIQYCAIKAIQGCARAGQPIPEELLVYMDQLCDDATKGNYDTKREQNRLISAVEKLRSNGMNRDPALEKVAEENSIKLSTLTTRYKEGSARSTKDAVKMAEEMGKWGVQK